ALHAVRVRRRVPVADARDDGHDPRRARRPSAEPPLLPPAPGPARRAAELVQRRALRGGVRGHDGRGAAAPLRVRGPPGLRVARPARLRPGLGRTIHQTALMHQPWLMYQGSVRTPTADRSDRAPAAPPEFLQVAGHPLRWRLLSELARCDRTVRELCERMGEPQNLVSYHLGKLRRSGLVVGRRSSADGRDTYYRVDLAPAADPLTATGAAPHPPAPRAPGGR